MDYTNVKLPFKVKALVKTSDWYFITPQMAEKILFENNILNRPIRDSHVRRLERMLEDGTFQTTHQGIAFDVHGRFQDGQHRLLSIANTGIGAELLVCTGMPEKAFVAIDSRAAARSVSDSLGIAPGVAEACTVLYHVNGGRNAPAPVEVAPYVTAFGDSIDFLLELHPRKAKKMSTAPVRAAFGLHLAQPEARGKTEEITDIYAMMVDRDYARMPPRIASLVRQLDAGSVWNPTRTREGVAREETKSVRVMTRADVLFRTYYTIGVRDVKGGGVLIRNPEALAAEVVERINATLTVFA